MPSVDRLQMHVTERNRDAAIACLAEFETATPDRRKRAVQSLRSLANDDPTQFDDLGEALVSFLEDDQRAVRLSTAKLLVAVAEVEPTDVRPVVAAVADRLADEEEFYYVRARCAEALGYVALEHPDDVNSPETLADLRIGLEFDEPEVREKLAKALEYVALGDPGRLRHQVSNLAEHLDDENDLVRYHLCTALVAVGSAFPENLTGATAPLRSRLDDPSPFVRGRAAEALFVLADAGHETSVTIPEITDATDGGEQFAAERARALASRVDGADVESADGSDPIESLGSVGSIRRSTETALEEMTSPDAGECPHCGLELPEQGPPMCPRCGAPR